MKIMRPDGILLFANGSTLQRKHETGVKESYLFRQADPREKVRKELMKNPELDETQMLLRQNSTNEMQI